MVRCSKRTGFERGPCGGRGNCPAVAEEGGEAYNKVMGTFYTSCRVENHVDRSKSVRVPKLPVDTGSEFTWISAATLVEIAVRREKKDLRCIMANGEVVTRSVGFAILRVANRFTIDEVVFAELGDLALLGSRTLEGLNLTVDPARKKLAAAGPLPAA